MEIDDLKSKLSLNSSNSSKPPSSDTFSKPKVSSLRKQSGKAPGKQKGSKGHFLSQVDVPDEIIKLIPKKCLSCSKDLDLNNAQLISSRQVFDLPPVTKVHVSEYQLMKVKCSECESFTIGEYPDSASAQVCYGPKIKAYVAYLSNYQHLPFERIQELLHDLFNIDISTGTLINILDKSEDLLSEFSKEVKNLLVDSELVHADETGLKVETKNKWVHSISNRTLTLYHLDDNRGRVGMDNMGILDKSLGTVIHDGWIPYRSYDNLSHGLCNSHHLRELKFIEESTDQKWAKEMANLLTNAYEIINNAKDLGRTELTPAQLTDLRQQYRKLIKNGYKVNPPPIRNGKRGRLKNTKAYNLLKRLDIYENDVLRFATDFRVPFDNNQAERDIRMVKLKQKISGGFRTVKGARSFLALRSYISTAKKQNKSIIEVIELLYSHKPWIPHQVT